MFSFVLYHETYLEILKVRNLEIWGLLFGPGILGGFVERPTDFLGLDFYPIDHPRRLKSQVPPPGLVICLNREFKKHA